MSEILISNYQTCSELFSIAINEITDITACYFYSVFLKDTHIREVSEEWIPMREIKNIFTSLLGTQDKLV